MDRSKKAVSYLAMVHVEALVITYLWTGELVGSVGAVLTILGVSFPTYLAIEKFFDGDE